MAAGFGIIGVRNLLRISLIDFALRRIRDFDRITDTEALALISEYLQTESPGRRDSIEAALDRRFGKPTGTICGLVFQRDLSDPKQILEELKRDTRIYL